MFNSTASGVSVVRGGVVEGGVSRSWRGGDHRNTVRSWQSAIRYWGGVQTTANPVAASADNDGADTMKEFVGTENEYRANLDAVRKALSAQSQKHVLLAQR